MTSISSARNATAARVPPGPRMVRLLANLKIQFDPAGFLEDGKQYGDVWMVRLLPNLTFVIVADPKLVEDVFNADPSVMAHESGITPLVGHLSVLTLDEPEHSEARKLLQPLFHGERVKRFRDRVAEICDQEFANWPLNEPIASLPRFQTLALSSIIDVVYGANGSRADEIRMRFENLLGWGASRLRVIRMQQTVMRDWKLPKSFLRLREPVDEIVFEEIGRARRDPSLGEREDVVAKLVQSRSDRGEPLTDREIRDHLVTLTFQGHRSTANALAWTLERLTRHPESLEKAEAEAQTDNEDYLDAVVKEALRVRPPFPFVMRTLQAPLPLAEYELAAGMTIALNAYILHRREDEYPEPERFRPERFLERPPRPYHWIPFGGDPRACVGAGFALFEMKIALHRLLQRFRLATTTEPDEKVKKLGVQFSPSRGGRVVLLERS